MCSAHWIGDLVGRVIASTIAAIMMVGVVDGDDDGIGVMIGACTAMAIRSARAKRCAVIGAGFPRPGASQLVSNASQIPLQICRLRLFRIASRDCTPTRRSTSFPFFNISSVGIP